MRSTLLEDAVGRLRPCEHALASVLLLIATACATTGTPPRSTSTSTPLRQPPPHAAVADSLAARCPTLVASADSARPRPAINVDTLSAAATEASQRSREYPQYDVVLDVPAICVDGLTLKVDSLKTRLALDTKIANLVRINAGADVVMGNVDVSVKGMRATALLLIDLTDAVRVVDQTLTFVDNHPEVVPTLRSAVETASSTIMTPTRSAALLEVEAARRFVMLGTMRNKAGQTVQRLLDAATGDIVERTLASARQDVLERAAGNVAQLTVIDQTSTTAGMQARVRDASGVVISFIRSSNGKVFDVKVERE
jgi:hypothetical protein